MNQSFVSVILPVHNEAGNLGPLVKEFKAAFDAQGLNYEIIFVNDASTDGSAEEIGHLQNIYPNIVCVKHAKNYGQSAAFASGFKVAKGDIFLTMDADGQNVPNDLDKLLAKLAEGYDAVYGVRQKRSDSAVKKLSSKIGNKFRDAVTGVKVHDAGCAYRVFYKHTLNGLPVFNGLHRFLPTLWSIHGFKVGHVPVGHRPRIRGVSKYGIKNRAFRGIGDCLAMRWYRKRALPGVNFDVISNN